MKKVGVIGHFGFGKELLNGQTIKTKIITEEFERRFGRDNIAVLDIAGGVRRIPYLLLKTPGFVRKCGNIVIMPVENGLRLFTPLLNFLSLFYKRGLHYAVIGGWLPEFLSGHKGISRGLKKFDGIYVETDTMKSALEESGFKNIFVMPNCKKLCVLSESELIYHDGEPYRLCTFSRVMKEKGIEDAVSAVKDANSRLGRNAFSLDIYGQVDPSQTEWFEALKADFPEYIKYRGAVPFDQSVDVLKNYFALLFPTRFYTEGIPGTVIDAYAAGVPVISARWESFADIIDDGVTGIGYEFGNSNELTDMLCSVAEDPESLLSKKTACLNEAKKYLPEEAVNILAERLS